MYYTLVQSKKRGPAGDFIWLEKYGINDMENFTREKSIDSLASIGQLSIGSHGSVERISQVLNNTCFNGYIHLLFI